MLVKTYMSQRMWMLLIVASPCVLQQSPSVQVNTPDTPASCRVAGSGEVGRPRMAPVPSALGAMRTCSRHLHS